MEATATTRLTWQETMRRLLTGETATGAELLTLRGYNPPNRADIDPEREYSVCERGMYVHAGKLAAKGLSELAADSMMELAWELGYAADSMMDLEQEPTQTMRCTAWEIGAAADFAAGVSSLEGSQ